MTTSETGRCPKCGDELSLRALPWGELYCGTCKRYVILGHRAEGE